MRLFGVDIVVPRDDAAAAAADDHHPDDQILMIDSGIGSLCCSESGFFLLQEKPNDEHSSDENPDASASPGLFTAGSSSASIVAVEEKEKPAFAMKGAQKVDFSVSRRCYDCRVYNPVPLRCIPPDISQETCFSQRPPTQELDEKETLDISAADDEDIGLYNDSPCNSGNNVDETIAKAMMDCTASRNRRGYQIYNPMPLRYIPLTESSYSGQKGKESDESFPTTVVWEKGSSSNSVSRAPQEKKARKTRKRNQENVAAGEERRRGTNNRIAEEPKIIPSLEQLPRMMIQNIDLPNGTVPVFLYQKRLTASDVDCNQHRLLLTNCENLMAFLTEEERTSVDTGKGFNFITVDPNGNEFDVHMGKFATGKMPIINSGWKNLVVQNNVLKGHWVELWGYRKDHRLGLAVNFRKPEGQDEYEIHA